MCVLLFNVFNRYSLVQLKKYRNVKHVLLRKSDFLKICRERKFPGKKIWRNALALKSKKVQGLFGEMFILALPYSAGFGLHNCLSDFY